ncbi:MAG: serine/threonine-protein kinase, partial [Verrucomicrobiales bacterium]
MKTEIDSNDVCKTCGASIPDGAPGGLCPACILISSQSPTPLAGAPSVEQIAGAFPELEVLGLIGRGGMGAVYHARQPKLDRDLALKVLLPDLGADPAFEERFSREARALAKLNHPNIVGVYDFGDRDGLFYLTMEYVDGVNLRQAMAAGRFTPEQAVAVIPGICDALQEAHGRGILHRDIKPENILLDRDGKVKIVDFGIARMVGDGGQDFTLTQSGAVIGSRQYMAPEQLEGSSSIDQRADIYSLGVVFYEMLTGELPIGRFLPPSEKSATTKYIDEVVMRSLEKELERRFQSVGDVKTEVENAAANRAVSPVPPAAKAPKPVPGEVAGVAKMTLWVSGLILLAPVLAGLA